MKKSVYSNFINKFFLVPERLHVVCLDAPSPPDYGGAIDMYYKIKALAASGVKITLHYFNYKKGRNTTGLENDCVRIYAYKRKSFLQSPSFSKPHIVASRVNKTLIERLNKDADPVLLEGIHCTGILPFLKTRKRKLVVRLHNIESVYYENLAATETNVFKRAYYARECFLLKTYQEKLPASITYATLSQNDTDFCKRHYGFEHVFLLPAFVPWPQVTSRVGSGTYCLYHGNIAIAENKAAALWLIENVFSKTDVPFIIAGKNIPQNVITAAAAFSNIQCNSNPSTSEMEELIAQAQIHVLPDLNKTGIKLKLLHALFCGRFCITNSSEIKSSQSLALAESPQDVLKHITHFMQLSFSGEAITERQKILSVYNNKKNAEILNTLL